MQSLKIVTINTWKGEANYDARIMHLKKALYDLKPDLILMQECFEAPSINKDTIAFINKDFNYHLDFLQAREKIRDFEELPVQCFSNMGILSRLPIINSYHYPLPLAQGDQMRFGQEIEILLENGKTGTITNVHLTHINTKDAKRFDQIKTITERIKGNQDKLQIIGGDFNCSILSTEIQYLMKEANLIESFSFIHPDKPHITLVDYFKKQAELGVDFLFVYNKVKKIDIQEAGSCLQESIDIPYGYCSDHFGMSLTIQYA
jgi:endonuclease/exonuclease/phosphatase family metal-dependent hydrolase